MNITESATSSVRVGAEYEHRQTKLESGTSGTRPYSKFSGARLLRLGAKYEQAPLVAAPATSASAR